MGDLTSLANSIRGDCLLQPIGVLEKLELVSAERRLKSHQGDEELTSQGSETGMNTFALGPTPNTVRTTDGKVLTPPEGWVLFPPGDAALTRRVKAAGDHWVVQE